MPTLPPAPLPPPPEPVTVKPVTHYENFPVASWLCPTHLRPAIAAIYHFARTADDLADEGTADATTRLSDLAAYRAELMTAASSQSRAEGRWSQVFTPLGHIIWTHHLPLILLTDLLDAFEQDVRYTAQQRRYADDAELLDYCKRSANPIGRLLLHLYGISDGTSMAHSDAICTALQLVNFWQDVSVDLPRGRWYPSVQAMANHGVLEADLQPHSQARSASTMIASYVSAARAEMLEGAELVHRIPGRAGWELRLVVQGGLRVLDKIEALGFATWRTRPKLTALDAPWIIWRSLWM